MLLLIWAYSDFLSQWIFDTPDSFKSQKGLKEIRSKISLEGVGKSLFTSWTFTQGDLNSTGGIQISFLGVQNSTGGI